MKWIPAFLAAPLCALSLALPVQGQSADEEVQGPPVVSLKDVRMESFLPKHVPAGDLYRAALQTVGRDIYLKERGGEYANPAPNLSMLADRILIYDEPHFVDMILEALKGLDQPASSTTVGEVQWVTREYAPRYITLDSAAQALRPYDNQFKANRARTVNVNFVNERNMVILRDEAPLVEEMLEVLHSVDTPEPQAMLTCYVVSGSSEFAGPDLPKDLAKDMEALLPGMTFRGAGFGMLRASIAAGRTLSLRVESEQAGFQLSFQPVAFDPSTASLTVQKCKLERDQYQTVWNGQAETRQFAGRETVFSTNAVLRGGEYTVLGSSGAEPLFLVLRLTPLD